MGNIAIGVSNCPLLSSGRFVPPENLLSTKHYFPINSMHVIQFQGVSLDEIMDRTRTVYDGPVVCVGPLFHPHTARALIL